MKRQTSIRYAWPVLFITACCSVMLMAQPDFTHWQQIPLGTQNNLNDMTWHGNDGIVVGGWGTVYISQDLGSFWIDYSLDIEAELFGVDVSRAPSDDDSYYGTIAGSNSQVYLFTKEPGQDFMFYQQQVTGLGNFNDIFYAYSPTTFESYAYLVGQNSNIWQSMNGTDWTKQTTPYQFEHFNRVYFLNNFIGYIVGSTGIIYQTFDGGLTWIYMPGDHTNPEYFGVYFLSPSTGWLSSSGGGIYYTKNEGNLWTKQTTGTTQNFNDLLFTDVSNGLAVGDDGVARYTTNGGTDWMPLDLGISEDLNRISLDPSGNIWICGDGGILFTNKQQEVTFTTHRTQLNFGAIVNGKYPDPQQIYVNTKDNQLLGWILTPEPEWLKTIPKQGTGTGCFSVYVNQTGLSAGTYTGTVTIETSQAIPVKTTVKVIMAVKEAGQESPPFGSFDTPLDNSTVRSSIPVTGWVLDDIDVESVKIYNGSQYVGDAVFVEGARPDVEQAYPDYPENQKAGWGYMLVTNFLPNGGNGTYILYARAQDREGNQVILGSKTIICDNAHAVKPFGAIDTPTPGGHAYGTGYKNQGWALTPLPNKIPQDGSTINVYVNGINVGHPTYNGYRNDIASLFPGYANSHGALGYFYLDTSQYENGVHTIQWTASDNAGNVDGIGSRYFTVKNTGDPAPDSNRRQMRYGSSSGGLKKQSVNIDATKTIGPYTQVFKVWNRGAGILNWKVTADQSWIGLNPESGTEDGWVFVTVNPDGLAAGQYQGEITIAEVDDVNPPEYIKVDLVVYDETDPPVGGFDYPDQDRVVSGSIPLSGWALDDIGVTSVKIYRKDGDAKIYVGDANFLDDARPDIATFYAYYPNSTRGGWSFDLLTNTLEDGQYTFAAEATDFEGNTTQLEGNAFVIDNTHAVLPFGSLDTPPEGEVISGDSYEVTGWALTPKPNTIPSDGSTIFTVVDGVVIGQVTYNIPRDDISSLFPDYLNAAGPGGSFTLNTTELADGIHTICWSVTDDASNINALLGMRQITIQNHSTVSAFEHNRILPVTTDLFPAYPNPFNPVTRIRYQLSTDTRVTLMIYDILGRRIITLLDHEYKKAGLYQLSWHGQNASDSRISSGVYVLVMKTDDVIKSQKLIMLK